jgi:acyl transferase domain-containing protein
MKPASSDSHRSGSSNGVQHDGLEPIAIVGMSMRFPDGAESSDAFWKLLVEKRCASAEYPKDRMNIDAFYSADAKKLNTVWLPCGGAWKMPFLALIVD